MVCDRIGRIWATRQLCILWIVGIAIFMGNGGSLGAVYAGRFIAGLGIGQTVVVGPVYLAEIVCPLPLVSAPCRSILLIDTPRPRRLFEDSAPASLLASST